MNLSRNYADVFEETRRYVLEEGLAHGHSVTWAIARRMGSDNRLWPGETFHGQVRRALDSMAKDGTLVKVKRGQQGPDGHWATRPLWYTADQYRRLRERHEEEQAALREQAETERTQWEQVYDRLMHAGYLSSGQVRGDPISLTPYEWEYVLVRLKT